MRTRWPFAAAVLAATLAAQAPPVVAAPRAAPLPAAAAELVLAFQRAHGIPGLSVAIGSERGVLAQGFGVADLENDVPATAATVYRLGSISKTVTAVAALQLVAERRLDLDADVRTWLPEFPAKPWPVTLRQLLGHQAGVRHYLPLEGESTVHYRDQRAALARFASDPLRAEPGTEFHYSTYGYNLVAAAVESARAAPFAAVVAALAAACDAPSLQDDDVRRLIRHRAQGYIRAKGAAVDGPLANSALMDGSYKLGGGGLCSDAGDLVRFGLALLDGRLLPPSSWTLMTTAQRTQSGAWTGYGMGLRIGERDGRAEYHHGGAQSRVSTVLLLVPEPRTVVAVLCNLEGVQALPLARQLADHALAPRAR